MDLEAGVVLEETETVEDNMGRVGARGIGGVASDYAADRKGPTLRI